MRVCPACGFTPQAKSQVDVEDGDLYEISRDKKQKISTASINERQNFYSELLLHAQLRGYKKGWASYAYKEKYKQWPESYLMEVPSAQVGFVTQNWIIARNIRKAKSKNDFSKFKKFAGARS